MTLADRDGDIATLELVHGHDKQPHIVTEYLKRVQAVSWDRNFMEATPYAEAPDLEVGSILADDVEPNFGLAPPSTQSGDRVYVLLGCSVPRILRPLNDGSGHRTFVREAYIYGKIDGEAVAVMSDSVLQRVTKEFIVIWAIQFTEKRSHSLWLSYLL
jgi:hypothetical protein